MRRALWLIGLLVLGGCRSLQVPVGALVSPEEATWTVPPPLVVRWRRDVEAAPARALVAGRILLVTNHKGDVHAFELPEGRRRGVLDVGRDLMGVPAHRKSLLVVPVVLDDAAVVAYDLYRRRTVWRRTGDGAEAGPVLDGEVVYVAERWGRVYALNVEDGRERWVQEPEVTGLEGVRARPVRVGELLVVADKRGRVVALEVRTGRLRWQRQLSPVYADLAAVDGRVLVPTTRGRLVALEAASGVTAWMLALPDTSVHLTTPAMAGSTVYVAGGDGVVWALMLRTGMVRWTWTGGAAIVATPVVDTTAGVLYVGDLRGRLVALELTNGRLRWETRLEDGVLELIGSPFGLIALTRPRHVYLLQSDHEPVASRP
ncbi:PQQ-binding-like beta-propeller repeat protein [Rhodothermus marinus]|uniref:Pyrrolo-quinoline quinone n=1 Tax=Rhodothermus marinus (strain ATCC 43812 / DSM 4252 / R-10) TaxID=518766 RepID=D0MJF5_RHOM4|nr:PQQ-binding-like beta-propeller repeat protein [Rhodothermus marinus]ACY48613.1 Pyrrolo-quinoline quinone [Rhodothermus marinus DSM 4252]